VGGQVRYGVETCALEVYNFARHSRRARATNRWVSGPDSLFGHGARPAVAVLHDRTPTAAATKLYVCGGALNPEHSAVVECLDLSGDGAWGFGGEGEAEEADGINSDSPQWMRCADMLVGRQYACAAVLPATFPLPVSVSAAHPQHTYVPRPRLCVMGGLHGGTQHLGSMEVYDEADNEWVALPATAHLLTPRSMFALVEVDAGPSAGAGAVPQKRWLAIGGLTNPPPVAAPPPTSAAAAASTTDNKRLTFAASPSAASTFASSSSSASASASGSAASPAVLPSLFSAPPSAPSKHVVSSVEYFDPLTGRWTHFNALPGGGRYLCTAHALDAGRLVVVVGGCGPDRTGAGAGAGGAGNTQRSVLWCRPSFPPLGSALSVPSGAGVNEWHEIKNINVELYQHTAVALAEAPALQWAVAQSQLASVLTPTTSTTTAFTPGSESAPTTSSSSSSTAPAAPSEPLWDAEPYTIYTVGGTSRITPPADPPATTDAAESGSGGGSGGNSSEPQTQAPAPFSRGVSYRVDLPKPVLIAATTATTAFPSAAAASTAAANPSVVSRACRVCLGGASPSADAPSLTDPKWASKVTLYSQPLPPLAHGRWGHASVVLDPF
jgi:hypothetical protein